MWQKCIINIWHEFSNSYQYLFRSRFIYLFIYSTLRPYDHQNIQVGWICGPNGLDLLNVNLRGGGPHSKFSAQGAEFLAMALGGGTGLIIANDWKCINLPSLGIKSSFESHSVTITHSIKMHFVVVYRPPGPQGNFLDELDVLLSTFPEDGTPLVMLGDFNIHPDKPQAADFHTLLAFFISRVLTSATHKTGNQLDLIYTRHSSTDHVLVTPLHTSDHFLLNLNLDMVPDKIHTTPHVIFRRNLRSLSHTRLSAMVSSLLPHPKQLASLDANSATDTFCSTHISCLDTVCPLSSRPACTTPSAPWL